MYTALCDILYISALEILLLTYLLTYCITEDITFDDVPSPQHPKIHTNALIRCKVSGEPMPEVTWRYGGKRILFTGKFSTNVVARWNLKTDRADQCQC